MKAPPCKPLFIRTLLRLSSFSNYWMLQSVSREPSGWKFQVLWSRRKKPAENGKLSAKSTIDWHRSLHRYANNYCLCVTIYLKSKIIRRAAHCCSSTGAERLQRIFFSYVLEWLERILSGWSGVARCWPRRSSGACSILLHRQFRAQRGNRGNNISHIMLATNLTGDLSNGDWSNGSANGGCFRSRRRVANF